MHRPAHQIFRPCGSSKGYHQYLLPSHSKNQALKKNVPHGSKPASKPCQARKPTCQGLALNGCQEVALVFKGISAPEKLQLPSAGTVANSGVVPCGHSISSHTFAVLQKSPKLNVAVACQVWVWRHSRLALHITKKDTAISVTLTLQACDNTCQRMLQRWEEILCSSFQLPCGLTCAMKSEKTCVQYWRTKSTSCSGMPRCWHTLCACAKSASTVQLSLPLSSDSSQLRMNTPNTSCLHRRHTSRSSWGICEA